MTGDNIDQKFLTNIASVSVFTQGMPCKGTKKTFFLFL